MGGEFVELVIHTLELTYPVGKGILYLTSVHVETPEQESDTDQMGPPKSRHGLFGYRRGEKRFAHRPVAVLLGAAVCFPVMALLVWGIFRLAA
jgi:hypothetical protein